MRNATKQTCLNTALNYGSLSKQYQPKKKKRGEKKSCLKKK